MQASIHITNCELNGPVNSRTADENPHDRFTEWILRRRSQAAFVAIEGESPCQVR
jgi:hypothetical protein